MSSGGRLPNGYVDGLNCSLGKMEISSRERALAVTPSYMRISEAIPPNGIVNAMAKQMA